MYLRNVDWFETWSCTSLPKLVVENFSFAITSKSSVPLTVAAERLRTEKASAKVARARRQDFMTVNRREKGEGRNERVWRSLRSRAGPRITQRRGNVRPGPVVGANRASGKRASH